MKQDIRLFTIQLLKLAPKSKGLSRGATSMSKWVVFDEERKQVDKNDYNQILSEMESFAKSKLGSSSLHPLCVHWQRIFINFGEEQMSLWMSLSRAGIRYKCHAGTIYPALNVQHNA